MRSILPARFYPLFMVLVLLACNTFKPTMQQPVPVPPATPVATIPVQAEQFNKEDVFFEKLFAAHPRVFDSVLANRKHWNIQVIYTQIDRDRHGQPEFTQHYFNRANVPYYYPASTVKLPIVLLALQKLNSLRGRGVDRNSTMITEAAYSGQTAVYNDPNSPDGRPTIEQYIKKILLVSDNDAFNRLYEFLGQDYINTELHKRGYTNAQILHRLDIFLSEEENRHTNPVVFYDLNNRELYRQPMVYGSKQYAKRNDSLGSAHYRGGELVNSPMNFSKKNRLSLEDLHSMVTNLVFPSKAKPGQAFDITEADRQFVLKYMSAYPSESVYPAYDSTYHDAYAKMILYGSGKGTLPKHIRIFNKYGIAYGQIIDAAYVVDLERKVEFLVSAVIYANADGVMNDDQYDYEQTAQPFMKQLGEALYAYELRRKRKNVPDVSSFIFQYDK